MTKKVYAFEVGDVVKKEGGDYVFYGIIVARFRKLHSNHVRYVVQNIAGLCHIFNETQLEKDDQHDDSWRNQVW